MQQKMHKPGKKNMPQQKIHGWYYHLNEKTTMLKASSGLGDTCHPVGDK